jgi:hypothetical protein
MAATMTFNASHVAQNANTMGVTDETAGIAGLGLEVIHAVANKRDITFHDLATACDSAPESEGGATVAIYNSYDCETQKRIAVVVGFLQHISCEMFQLKEMHVNEIVSKAQRTCSRLQQVKIEVKDVSDASFWNSVVCHEMLKSRVTQDWIDSWTVKANLGVTYKQLPLATLHAALQEWNFM